MIIDLNLYKVFLTVAKYQNISHAADILFVSQPAVSKSIKTLEKHLNIQLFSRNSKGVSLTPEGKILYEHIETAFNHMSIGENYIEKLKNKEISIQKIKDHRQLQKMLVFLLLKLRSF